MISINKIIRN